MVPPNAFQVLREDNTLIVVPLRSISSLAEDSIQQELDDLFQQIQGSEINNLIFDFEKLADFGSCMLEAMRAVSKQVLDQEGKMGLCNVSVVAKEILQLVKFDTRWPIYSSREKAIKALR